jgi:hypothetical protein
VPGRCSSRDYAAVAARRFRFVIPVGPSRRCCTMRRCVCMYVRMSQQVLPAPCPCYTVLSSKV